MANGMIWEGWKAPSRPNVENGLEWSTLQKIKEKGFGEVRESKRVHKEDKQAHLFSEEEFGERGHV